MSERALTDAPHSLKFEHLDDAVLGTDVRSPRLSWQLPDAATRQSAYELHVGEWSSGIVKTSDRVLVHYPGPQPSARERIQWKVRVWTDLGPSEWSEPAFWEMGLLSRSDWTAEWIRPHEVEVAEPGHRPVYALHSTLELEDRVSLARAYVTAHGVYELFVNGERVGDQELTPGFTAYRSNLQVQTYDIGRHLRVGTNSVGVLLSDGWYRGLFGYSRTFDNFGPHTALLAQFEATDVAGRRKTYGTNLDWSSTISEAIAADLLDGQHSVQHPGGCSWSRTDWQPVLKPVDPLCDDWTRLRATAAPPMRAVRTIPPASVSVLDSGRQIVDLGENTNGWVRLRTPDSSATLTLTHGEALIDGDVSTDHLRPYGDSPTPSPFYQIDSVRPAGDGQVFEPRHTTHGFRYVAIDGAEVVLDENSIVGVEVRTDLRHTGSFECSDQRLNRLHEAAVRSWRTNACDVPTDCPQRERAAWTGDFQIFASTAVFLDDVAGFTDKWLRDLSFDQLANGMVRNYAPSPEADVAPVEGSSGWGDATVSVPWQMWQSYRDIDLLRRQYPSAVAWLEWVENIAATQRAPERVEANEVPLPHELYLWDTGFHWGEWHEPGVAPDPYAEEQSIVATAYFARSARLLSKTAEVLGRSADATRFVQLAENVERAWVQEFVGADGMLARDTQATYVRALAFGLVPKEWISSAVQHLVDDIRSRSTHLATGFLSTGMLLPLLVESGHADLAFDLLFQDTAPSWLCMIDRGATTIWENWEGIDAAGHPHDSLNHYSKGVVVQFLHRYVAGIRPLEAYPGYERFVVEPALDDRLDWARATLETPFGRVESSWRREAEKVTYEITVPADTQCEFLVEPHVTLAPGTHVLYR